jgi:hypothetical protein
MGLGLSLHLHVSIRRGKNDFNQLGVFFLLINRNSRRRIDTQQFLYISFQQNPPTSLSGCLRLSEEIFRVSSLEIFFLMAGFSKTIFNEEPLLTTLFPGDSVVSVLVKAMVVETKVETATERNFILILLWWCVRLSLLLCLGIESDSLNLATGMVNCAGVGGVVNRVLKRLSCSKWMSSIKREGERVKEWEAERLLLFKLDPKLFVDNDDQCRRCLRC